MREREKHVDSFLYLNSMSVVSNLVEMWVLAEKKDKRVLAVQVFKMNLTNTIYNQANGDL